MARSRTLVAGIVGACAWCAVGLPASAQQAGAPPAVGVVSVVSRPVTKTSEYLGRIQAKDRVNVVARVSAFLDKQFFKEGNEVKAGDLLYRLEQAPFEADVDAKKAAVAQFKAQLENAKLTLDRAVSLLKGPAGMQSAVDSAKANELSLEAQVLAAEAQLRNSEINLGYTEIRAPVDGKIGRTAITPGNYVSPGSGVLTTIVSQDPMYVVFPVSTRAALDIPRRAPDGDGFGSLVIKVKLPDGRIYDGKGTLEFLDNTVASTTDTLILRGTVPNPRLTKDNGVGLARELVDGEFVSVILEDAQPTEAPSVPMAAVLADQQGNYVYAVDSENKAQIRRVKIVQSTPGLATISSGLSVGEKVVVEGIQRVRPGQPVSPGPANEPALTRSERSRGAGLEGAGETPSRG